jgi:predicted transglutaminase-like cysteine proteinase
MTSIGTKMRMPINAPHDVGAAIVVLGRADDTERSSFRAFPKIKSKAFLGLAALMSSLFLGSISPALALEGDGTFLHGRRVISAPSGASGLCAKYAWACSASGQSHIGQSSLIQLAVSVNTKVNRQTKVIADKTQYGREEYWTLPTAQGGDCEDFALLKKKMLIEYGVAPENLLIATVLDRQMKSHAVLLLRTAKGDVILDNLNKDILPWRKTGYTFLKMQSPKSPRSWLAVLDGGIIRETPTATW